MATRNSFKKLSETPQGKDEPALGHSLSCVLPSTGKQLRLRVIISKRKGKKMKKEPSTPYSHSKSIVPVKEERKGENLLDVLIKLCEEDKLTTTNKTIASKNSIT